LTSVPGNERGVAGARLGELCGDPILLTSRYRTGLARKVWDRAAGICYCARTGLKVSNYVIGQVELNRREIARAVASRQFDGVLFEYWHAVESVSVFQRHGTPCVLDMHNILWQSFSRQLTARTALPEWWRNWSVQRYRIREERAWNRFDALVAINQAEESYTSRHVAPGIPIFYAPMGTDLKAWPYAWKPADPPRIAYYGGLGSAHNQEDALTCATQILPLLWSVHPQLEFWIVGSNPPQRILDLQRDPRIRATGFLARPQEVLGTMSAVLCPWSGRYGFRSRLVEVMALGVPVVTTPDAVHGMDFEEGVLLASSPGEMARQAASIVSSKEFAEKLSQSARRSVEAKYSAEANYGRLTADLRDFFERAGRSPTRMKRLSRTH
jgi:glycosyltransferase involved in cell wall biosynthesis